MTIDNVVIKRKREGADVRFIILHHSATLQGNAEIFEQYHKDRLGYSAIGYHYVICNGNGGGDGEIQPGRDLVFCGAHAQGKNHDSVGICLVGDFTKDRPTKAQMQALIRLIKELMQKYPIAPARVLGHNEVNPTKCPGSLSAQEVRRALTEKLPRVQVGKVSIDGVMIDGKLFVPVREFVQAMTEAAGFWVDWDEDAYTAFIKKGGLSSGG